MVLKAIKEIKARKDIVESQVIAVPKVHLVQEVIKEHLEIQDLMVKMDIKEKLEKMADQEYPANRDPLENQDYTMKDSMNLYYLEHRDLKVQ